MIEAVIVDMDGLLIDSEPYWQEVEHAVFGQLGLDITPDMHVETYGLGLNEVIKHWYRYKPWDGDVSDDEIKATIVQQVTSRIRQEGTALPGVYELLRLIRSKQIPLALASASPLSMIEAVLEKLSLEDTFQCVHSCDFEDFEKPHPAVYLTVAEKLGVMPANCLVFEDSLVGVIAAKAARMQVIAVPHDNYYQDARFSLADSKIPSLLHFTAENWNIGTPTNNKN